MHQYWRFCILVLVCMVCHCVQAQAQVQEQAQVQAQVQAQERNITETIIRATRFDDIETVKNFAHQGGDVNLVELDRGESLLMMCIREGSIKVFHFLLQHPRIQIDQRAKNGDTAIMLAVYLEKVDLLERLVEQGAKLNQTGWTALHYAAVIGNDKIIAFLLAHDAEIDAETPNQTTPLMLAARRGEMAALRLLLDHGANVSRKNMLGWTAFDFAVEAERRDIAEYLKSLMNVKQ